MISLVFALEVLGVCLLGLSLAHVLLWRWLGWTREMAALSPLTARVFAVHTFFVALVLFLLGALTLSQPEQLTASTPLARFVTGGSALFFFARLLAQPFVFDPVLLPNSRLRLPVRFAATFFFAFATSVYAWAFTRSGSGG